MFFKKYFIRMNISLIEHPNPSTEDPSMAFVDLLPCVEDQSSSIGDLITALCI